MNTARSRVQQQALFLSPPTYSIASRSLSASSRSSLHTTTMSAKPRIAILDDYQHCALEMADWSGIKQRADITVFYDTIPHSEPPSPELVERLKPFDIISTMRERTPFQASLLRSLPNLKLLCTTARVNRGIDVAEAEKLGITVCGTASSGQSTNEFTWALILSLARNIPQEDANMKNGGWQKTLGFGLQGKKLGLLGLGKLGTASAGIGKAFGMEIIAWSPNLTEERCAKVGARLCNSKKELFQQADILSIHMVLSKTTRGLVQKEDLEAMKPSSLFVNTSRGPIVDTDALIDVLKKKKIQGAALDVFDIEPLPTDHELRKLDNVILSPHLVDFPFFFFFFFF